MTTFSTLDHPRDYPGFRYLYPVLSRRRGGLSLGVNLNPDKACTFNCSYCQVDRTTPGDEGGVDPEAVRAELERFCSLAAAGRLDELPGFGEGAGVELLDVSFSGDGEPTTERAFPALADAALDCVARHGLGVPVIVFTNASCAGESRVLAALHRVLAAGGAVWAKLDAGSDEGLRRVAGTSLPMRRLVSNLLAIAKPGPLTVQTLLCRDAAGPIPMPEVRAIAARLNEIAEAGGNVDLVQVHTVARPTPDPEVRALDPVELEERAALLREEQPFAVKVYR